MSIQITCKMFRKILKSIVQEENKVLVLFDDLVADMINKKKINPVVTELFIRGRKPNILLVFLRNQILKY